MDDQPKDELPTPTGNARSLVRQPLTSISGILTEAARVYRLARGDKMDHDKARSLVWMLSQIRAMAETQALERLEQRLDEMAEKAEQRTNGHARTDRQAHLTH